MLKNKIYKYLSSEIFKNFITILLTFAAIAWVVRAVNFLDLIVEDGHSLNTYLKYSALNITTIITRFVPLAFLLSLTVSIIKFENQQELLILWTTGLAKIKVVNIFLLIAFFVTLFQIILSLFINPYLLNNSRSLLSNTKALELNTVLKSNDFSDLFTGVTFYVDKKTPNNELLNIFIKDSDGALNTILSEVKQKQDTTVTAKKGFFIDDKLVLFNGIIQTLNQKNEIKNIRFEKTELSLNKMTTRTIKKPKVQETSSRLLLECIYDQNDNLNQTDCSRNNYKNEAVQTLSRRLGTPLYIPLISIIVSFLLIYKKEKKYTFLKKYMLFVISFIILIFAEILLKYTGFSTMVVSFYFILPIATSFLFYMYLFKKIMNEKIIK